ncbi:phosphatidylinositol-specific phospholipase C domain-containing protein [Rhodococcus maanshanensis]|uniref:phosphatidylinositol-specific phospholipase C domain-containing protein n=1 Tax=Rhodococcus maanshanensis TaxID=183556 RepID=UPI0022B4247C|nr:phosphatidylinositol-specific phospholipase C domain-containing protein [Rhodococcus maanshanensis]MCZ4558565.1 phosphatidylinositol-specific phospholipase C domain-containing protein [Rhodococcus maanshanensis]
MNPSRQAGIAALAATAAVLLVSAVPAQADPVAASGSPYSATTAVGVHNAYEQQTYEHLADALDSGAGLIELDVWTNSFDVVAKGGGMSDWRVSHENPLANVNNCANAAAPDQLRGLSRDQDLAGCLADLRVWHDANPGHRPMMIKIEMKDGFNAPGGLGPREFDALLDERLGSALFRPSDLTGGASVTLDEAVRADGWPGRGELAGKFIVELIPGTVEEKNPADPLWTDVEYATHLRDLAAAGALDEAVAFPAVHRAEAGDPRQTRYPDATVRPWFVIFDGDAAAFVNGGIDTAWYRDRGYLLVMTDAHQVAPAIDGTSPSEEAARARVDELAAGNASVVTADWHPLPGVLSRVVPRG